MKEKKMNNNRFSKLRKQAKAMLKSKKEKTNEFSNLSHEAKDRLLFELQIQQIELELQNEELRRVQLELEATRDKYTDLYDFAPTGYFTFDSKGYILEVNLSGASLLGIDRNLLIGKPFTCYINSDFQDEFYFYCKKLFKSNTAKTFELKLKKKDAADFHAQLDCIVVSDDSGTFNQIRAAISDISKRKQLEQNLLESKINAEFANKAKSQFLASMSHEIRTPMNAILGFTELLYSELKNKKQKRYIETIKNSGKNLLALINDILDLSKVEAGKMIIQHKPTNPHDIFNEIKMSFCQQITHKNLDFFMDISNNIPESIDIDEMRFKQILINLISNAIKFTKKGHIKVFAEKINTTENNDNIDLRIIVEDTGIGIPQESQKKIFESFTQQDDQDNKKFGGTGLGLSITKNLVELMNGMIYVKSTINKGSTFEILFRNITVTETNKKHKAHEQIENENLKFEQANVLVADDDSINRMLLREIFEDLNLNCIEAENGEQAVLYAEQHIPDVILLDIQMPVMDGHEAVKLIKNNKKIKQIPVIALTAMGMEEDRDKVKASGFDDYLLKPFTESELSEKLRKYIPYSIKDQ
ncbi:multi-sensor hybrid histidine kinase [Candidatus Magnetomorum sp. HK-1]|nr:multi-sensor hybrid histidine kinase [Candidatus Magnetomorum sp. HK-1]